MNDELEKVSQLLNEASLLLIKKTSVNYISELPGSVREGLTNLYSSKNAKAVHNWMKLKEIERNLYDIANELADIRDDKAYEGVNV